MTWDPQNKALGYAAIYVAEACRKWGKSLSSMRKEIIIASKMWDASNVKGYIAQKKRKVSIDKLPFFKR